MDTACTLFYNLMLKVIPELTVPTRQAQTHFAFDLPVSLCLLSHTEDRLPLQLSFYCWWWVSGGGFVMWYYTPPLSHLPFTLQTSIFPWPSKNNPSTLQARLMQLCIINTFNKKRGKSAQWSGSEHHHPLTQTILNASSQPWLFALEEADWESIAEPAVAPRLKRTTDKDISANEDNSAAPSYLFVPVFFI